MPILSSRLCFVFLGASRQAVRRGRVQLCPPPPIHGDRPTHAPPHRVPVGRRAPRGSSSRRCLLARVRVAKFETRPPARRDGKRNLLRTTCCQRARVGLAASFYGSNCDRSNCTERVGSPLLSLHMPKTGATSQPPLLHRRQRRLSRCTRRGACLAPTVHHITSHPLTPFMLL
jgi:hypothetical protein